MIVATKPTAPLISNSQPRNIVTARVASGGIVMARKPSTMRTTPSTKNNTQWSRTDRANNDPARYASSFVWIDMAYLLTWVLSRPDEPDPKSRVTLFGDPAVAEPGIVLDLVEGGVDR